MRLDALVADPDRALLHFRDRMADANLDAKPQQVAARSTSVTSQAALRSRRAAASPADRRQ